MNDLIIKANESQALYDLAALLSTLELSTEQQYFQFCRLIPATKAGDPKKGFYEGDDRLLRRRHRSIPGLQQNFIPYSLQNRLCTMPHF